MTTAIQKIIAIQSESDSDFAAYLNNEVDFVDGSRLSENNYAAIANDPQLAKQLHISYGDFQTYYLFFDLQNPPFNNLKVRQAFSHAIDRDHIVTDILKPIKGIPAFSYLMPGFPASNSSAYKGIQPYDITMAKQLLAEAGYPDGKGFPKLTMWLRKEPAFMEQTAMQIATTLGQLGITVEVANKERKDFADALNAKPTKIQFGMIRYGMDFLDPYNMLSVWLSGGRHNWNNPAFDELVKRAGAFTGAAPERIKLFQQAERMLVEDVGGVFIIHRTLPMIYRPYLVGSELEANDMGIAALHFPGYNSFTLLPGSLYISNDVLNYRKGVPQPPK